MRIALLLLPVLAFLIAFAGTYPDVLVNADEAKYVRQANAFAKGEVDVERVDAVSGERTRIRPSDYPVGTSLVLTPFVGGGGWRAAFWMPALALVWMMIFTALALKSGPGPPWFALVILLFPPALVMARVATSDVLSGAVVALGWFLFWRGANHGGRVWWWTAAGFVGGLSVLFRETNALLFAPVFAGALIRRDRAWAALLVGGLAGIGLRLLGSWMVFGDPLLFKNAGYGFSLSAIVANTPVYLIALLVFVPGGLLFALIYRGSRRPEVIATAVLFTLFYLCYAYAGQPSGFLKGLILGPRFFIPLLPVLAFAMGESAPRLLGRMPGRSWALPGTSALCIVAAVATNLAFAHWTETQSNIQRAVNAHVPTDAPVITNPAATEKFITELQGYSMHADYRAIDPGATLPMGAYVVFLQRSDSERWINAGAHTNKFLAGVGGDVVLDEPYSPTDRLRIIRITENE